MLSPASTPRKTDPSNIILNKTQNKKGTLTKFSKKKQKEPKYNNEEFKNITGNSSASEIGARSAYYVYKEYKSVYLTRFST